MPIQVIDTANQFRGKIVEIVLGSVVSEVEVETPWGKVASVITTRAVRELGLEIGSEVNAFVKVTDMAIATLINQFVSSQTFLLPWRFKNDLFFG